MKKIIKLIKVLLAILIVLVISSCSSEPNIKGKHLITIEPHTTSNKLFYTGSIQPLSTVVVASPADGVVIDMPFQYGEEVKTNQLLFKLSSTKFLNDYKTALMQYIKAKSDLNTNKTLLSEAEFLHKNLLISDDDFKMKQSNFYSAQLAFIQAKDALDILIQQLDIKEINLNKLSIADVDKINQAMHLQKPLENLRVLSPANGIILSATKNSEETKKISEGDVVKQGDVLAIIGDMNGISVHIKVNELTINQLKPGQRVLVTGIAFPDEKLEGKIKRVDRQGESSGNGLPNFPVEIVVPTLSQVQQNKIHVGMSAKVEIQVDEEAKIFIPINAVKENHNETFATLFDAKKGIHEVPIKTGKTTIDSVAILAGLKAGDKIVVPD